ncbi:MAG: MFS transporter [Phycisphaerae bacterium]
MLTKFRNAIRGNVLAMSLVSLFTDFSSEMMNPLLPIFIAGLVGGVEAAVYVGLMEGVAETTASLLKIFSGRISDKLGKRKALVILGYGTSSFARPLMGLAGLVWWATGGLQVVVLKFLDRVGKGIRTSPRDALIGDSVGPDVRGLAFSFHRSMDHAGAVLGPIVAIIILQLILGGDKLWSRPAIDVHKQAVGPDEMNALRWLFGVALLPGLAALAALVFRVREVAIIPKEETVNVGLWGSLPRSFRLFTGIVTLFALGNSSDMFIMLLAASIFRMSLGMLLVLWMVFHISKIVFSIPGGIISDRIGRRPVIAAGWIVYALTYAGFALAGWRAMAQEAAGSTPDQWPFWVLFLVYGFYYGACEGAEKALVTDFVPSEQRGTAFGIYHGAIGIAALPASLVFGRFWLELGPVWAFGIGAALAGAAAILMLALLTAAKRQSAE